jgi:hypothetical protein
MRAPIVGQTRRPVARSGTAAQTTARAPADAAGSSGSARYRIGLKRTRFGRAPSSPRRFFLSASYSW